MSRPRLFAATPVLVVSDLQRSIAFYGRLGFVAPATWGDPPSFAMLNRDGLDLMLSLGRPLPYGAGTWDLHLRVADVAAEQVALAADGVTLSRGPATTSYGMSEIEVIDPDGYRICLGQDIERRPADRDR